jgi:hypothetical protein
LHHVGFMILTGKITLTRTDFSVPTMKTELPRYFPFDFDTNLNLL